ncbi:unnamed protein product [Bursaphelenchus okinawaensis]|uniref:Aspartyl/asparaginy/proline hydroxylase domain-containing protein n=1 Tax=Bursaphelenchus okinawaensis TaxID=465554 RepID=A0A811LNF3_9BILA|nr:unnamed protein product [Bursaphelenchus okinawaensis]CAG9127077.1 unnamed protein product [Bursaphelenchus okinawaensis]
MSGSPNPYGHQNGTSAGPRTFRRQGSSYGPGHVHNMAVMVAPQKIDYSVTKGGLRSWAVLVVFVLLCSAMLAIFSEIEDGEDNDYVAHYVEEAEPDTIVPDTEDETDEVTPAPPDIEDAEEEEEDEEQQLFSSLLQKAKDRWLGKSKKKDVKKEKDDNEEDDEDGQPVDEEKLLRNQQRNQRKRDLRRRNRRQQESDEDDDDSEEQKPEEVKEDSEEESEEAESEQKKDSDEDDDDDDEEEEEELKKRVVPEKKNIVKEDSEEDENDDDDDDDDKNEKEEEKEPEEPEPLPRHVIKRQQKQAEIMKKEREEALKKAQEDDDDDDDDEEEDEVAMCVQKVKKDKKKKETDDDDDDEDDDEEVLVMPRTHREVRRSGKSWRQSLQAKRMAEDSKNPRKSLLKGKKRKVYPKLEQSDDVEDGDDDSREDDDNDDDDVEEEVDKVDVREVAATRKKTNNYNRKAVTNRHDYKHRSKLDLADYLVEKHDFNSAIQYYTEVIKDYKDSPRAHFGLGKILQIKAEEEETDDNMDKAINEFQKVLDEYDTPDELFKEAAENLVECARYRGNLHKVMTVQRELIDRFPEEIEIQTDFGITFLMMGRPDDARNIFTSILETDPQNSVAQAYYGYLLKVYDLDYEKGIFYMRRGLKSQDKPILDAKFYFHLGDGLQRLGRAQEALRVYEEAVELGLFPSVYQRSTYNLDGLTARPWWTLTQTLCGKHLKNLERQWTVMREEALRAWKDDEDRFKPEDAHLTEGHHKSLYLRQEGTFDERNCRLVPTTCKLLKEFAEESKCDKGDIRINVLEPGSRVWPRCGPTNFVLEAQLGLVSPSEARIRVAKEVRGWRTGKFLIFDESFEHEIWFDGAATHTNRIVLAIELWHPEVPSTMKADSVL